ncbi:c-type cytochrome [Psychrosphaera haliotis]|uniref:C-type cytochrome n=1 Tax=Psychrosphaera haliotis TaxID=555083 RepID=A0A6N8FF78_9GAMM|nr:c-type cytochrome [Psychrosphaera haliotis]MUH73332.1 c-type cytochrome [Psychrosphaera haliotis]
MKKAFLLAIAAVAAFSTQVQAADIEAGKAKAATCAACHGANGISAIPTYPNLAGQKPAYIVQQLKAFKSGERNNAIMKPMATMLTDADMINVAAYYASLK